MYLCIHAATASVITDLAVYISGNGEVNEVDEVAHILADTASSISLDYTPTTRQQRPRPIGASAIGDRVAAGVPTRTLAQRILRPKREATEHEGGPSSNLKQDRTSAVLAFIHKVGPVGVPAVSSHFPSVSSKTIQRELAELVQTGRLTKVGDRRWTTYSVTTSGVAIVVDAS
jgi:hypothetical protein